MEMNMVQAINAGLHQEMAADPDVVVLGEDVGRVGGVFRVTQGLHEAFGEQRVIDTPLNESGILGTAIGMALYGLKPIPEIQFADFIYPGFDQLVSEAAKYRYRSGGEYTVPMVVRTPFGGGIKGGLYHSQSPEARVKSLRRCTAWRRRPSSSSGPAAWSSSPSSSPWWSPSSWVTRS